MKRNIGKLLIASFSVFFVSACAYGVAQAGTSGADANMAAISKLESIKENHLAGLRSEAIQTKNPLPKTGKVTGPASAWMMKVKPGEVNMVTNRHEKKTQEEIRLDGKVYYGSGQGMAWNMTQNPSIRFSKDPVTNKTIDKAEAVIFADASGRVHYFESENSFQSFVSLATPQTVYGYSEPR